ncbi:MAG: hypothetical protein U5R14_03440 [Gemmatimonadota bacterium]|nr:hypothetical protein [Gemmatimonadota bacterium]
MTTLPRYSVFLSPSRVVPAMFGLVAMALAGVGATAQQGPAEPMAPAAFDEARFADLSYRSIGPSRGGRVTAVAGHPAHPSTFYMGSTGGGVWKTSNRGHSWENISDEYFRDSPAIGAIRVAPSNTDIVYVGTGSDGIRSNIIIGSGMYRSDDAGESWRHIGLAEAGQIGRMVVHPENPDVVYVGAVGNPFGPNEERGLYKTTDGGETWEPKLQIADSVGVYSVVMEPGDPDVIYATTWRAQRDPWSIISGMEASGGGGIYKSTDAGESWEKLTEGLPSGLIGKIDLTISDAAPRRIYALVEAVDEERGVYRSDDAGRTWRQTSNEARLISRPFYFTNIHADPQNPDQLYVGNVRFYRSQDGGETWERRSTPHADNHDLWINPENPRIQVQGNDGGANVTLDGGETWSSIHNQPTAELYQVDVDTRFPYWVYAGQQDNSTIAVPSLPPSEEATSGHEAWWRAMGGCETGPAVPRPDVEPLIVYSNCKGRFGRYSMVTGQEQQYYVGVVDMYGVNPEELPYRFQRTVPIEVSPHDPNLVFHGSQYVHRTTNAGQTWVRISPDLTAFRPERQVVSGAPINRDITGEEHYSTLYAIAASPHSRDEIWAGANDGPVHVTLDGGDTWTEVTPPDMPPEGRINDIAVSPHTPGKVYVAGYRYLLDDWRPYLYRTEDYGETWTHLTPGDNGIPDDNPVRVVREDPDREGLLYTGTERGVYVSFDDGASWHSFQLDLPVTPVTGIQVFRKDLVLSTMGRGFYILDNLTPLHQLDTEIEQAAAHLFEPRAAHRMRYGSGGNAPGAPEFPNPGARIDYWLGDGSADVSLEILDADGNTVRTFRSQDGEEDGPSADPGLNRFLWDLRYPGPQGGGRGPMAVPGRYTVRLDAAGETHEVPLEVLIDPRVRADGTTLVDLELQFEHNMRVRDLISDGRRALERIEVLEERASTEEERAEIREVKRVLLPPEDITVYPPRRLIDQIDYLYGATMGADQHPGNEALDRYEELRAEMDEVLEELGLSRLVSEEER